MTLGGSYTCFGCGYVNYGKPAAILELDGARRVIGKCCQHRLAEVRRELPTAKLSVRKGAYLVPKKR